MRNEPKRRVNIPEWLLNKNRVVDIPLSANDYSVSFTYVAICIPHYATAAIDWVSAIRALDLTLIPSIPYLQYIRKSHAATSVCSENRDFTSLSNRYKA